MTVVDLIMELSKMSPDLEVIYENTQPGDEGFRMVVIEDIGEITIDNNQKYVLINANRLEGEELGDEEL